MRYAPVVTPRRRTRQIAGTSTAAPVDEFLADDSDSIDLPRVAVDEEDTDPELEGWVGIFDEEDST